MRKVRLLAWMSGGFLITASIWAAVRYGNPTVFIFPAILGVFIPSIPFLLLRLKGRIAHGNRWLGLGNERSGEIYVSKSVIDDPIGKLATIVNAIERSDGVQSVNQEQFNEGPGVVVTHRAAHKTFVRFTKNDQLAITGATGHTPIIVETIEDVLSVSFIEQATSPFRKPKPVRGGLRVLLGVCLIGLVVVGTISLVGGAYPSDHYNASEKAVLALIDARAELNPGMTRTDAKIAKANFIVEAIAEEAVEIRWDQSRNDRIKTHANQVAGMRSDVRELLASVQNESPTAEQQAQIEQITTDLQNAEKKVAVAINESMNASKTNESSGELVAIQSELNEA